MANQLEDSTFLFETNSKDIRISKLVLQLKLFPSLSELKDNDTVVMSTITKKDISRNRSLFISKVRKIFRLLLVSQATNAESDDIPQVNYGKQPTARSSMFQCRCIFKIAFRITLI